MVEHLEKPDPNDWVLPKPVIRAVVVTKPTPQLNQDIDKKSLVVTCVFCGHAYPADTPTSGSQILLDHIKECKKHPLFAAEAKVKKLRLALAGLVGTLDKQTLKFMASELLTTSKPELDYAAAAALNAINALIATDEESDKINVEEVK